MAAKEANFFQKNRQRLHQKMYADEILLPLEDDCFEILEEKTQDDATKLQSFKITDICYETEDGEPLAWVLDLEKDNSFIFPQQEGFKKGEKALIVFTCTDIWIIIVELKTSLKPYAGAEEKDNAGLRAIRQKMEGSLNRILRAMGYYIFEDEHFQDIPVHFVGLVAYNRETITEHLKKDKTHDKKDIVKAFVQRNTPQTLNINTIFQNMEKLKLYFVQNPNTTNPQGFEYSLKNIIEEWEIDSAGSSELKCPHI